MKNTLHIASLILSVISGSYMLSDWIENTFDVLSMIAIPLFVLTSMMAVLIPASIRIPYVHRYFTSLVIWLAAVGIVFSILFFRYKIRNSSPILYAVSYYWEEGVDIYFRENGRFKAVNESLFSSEVTYGRYRIQDAYVILEDDVYWGPSKMEDTLMISNDGIEFKLETSWRGRLHETMGFKPIR